MFNPQEIKKHFPILNRKINGKDLVYLDNAATSQKPKQVIDALTHFYSHSNANVHRGIHTLSEEATDAYEATRIYTAKFINAHHPEEIIFTRNTTEAINLVAYTLKFSKEDEIIVSTLEHHSNLVPWQQTEATLTMSEPDEIQITEKTKLVAITGMSNALGTKPNIRKIIQEAHKYGAKVLIDAAQLICHEKIDVQGLDCDFLAFSGHKMLGPTGVGILYGKKEILENLPPYQTGGGMIKVVEDTYSTWANIPARFEAGTPNIADIIAFKTALEFIENIGMDNIQKHEDELARYAFEKLQEIPQLNILSPTNSPVISFTMKGTHPHDIATILDSEGIAIRAGHHCCQPLMRRLNVAATARMSFYLYNTKEDIDITLQALKRVVKIFNL